MLPAVEYLLFLRHVPLFRTLTFSQLRRLLDHIDIGSFHRGDVIFTEGEYDYQLYIIQSGRVRLLKGYATANEHTLASLGPTEFLGEMGLFEHAPHSLTAVAMEDTEVLLLPDDAFQYLLRHDPSIAHSLRRILSARIRQTMRTKIQETPVPRATTQHILVPLDGSATAEQALTVALTFATPVQARVTLLHVLEPPAFGRGEETPELEAVFASHMQHHEATRQQMLETAAQRVRAAGIPCDTLVVTGSPFQVIVDLARARRVDLIVMGSHGQTGLARILLGSVAERVVQLGPCAVLIVPPDTHAKDTERGAREEDDTESRGLA